MTLKVKEILKLVAESHYYTIKPGIDSSSFMCYSLTYAKDAGLISEKEKELATKAIEKYLSMLSMIRFPSDILHKALRCNGLPSSFEDCLNIYRDWKNRPKPWKRNENS